MKVCKYCMSQIDERATVCPYCQKKQNNIGGTIAKIFVGTVVVCVGLPIIVSAFSGIKSGYEKAEREHNSSSIVATDTAATTEFKSVAIYNDNDIKVDYCGFTEKESKIVIKFLVENNTDINYTFQARDFSIDGFMVDESMSDSVTSKKKGYCEMSISKDELQKYNINISTMKSAEFKLRATTFKMDDENFTSEPIAFDF